MALERKYTDIYFSFDVEADGKYPGVYSMLSIGMVACATYDGVSFQMTNIDDRRNQYYSTMKPVGDKFNKSAAEVAREGGANREELVISGRHPLTVMPELSEWIRNIADGRRPVAVAYPLGFDWGFLYYYMEEFSPDNPFGFSGHLDIKTFYAAKAQAPIINATKRNMPKQLRSKRPHTHNALDDALEQAELFCNVWRWEVP